MKKTVALLLCLLLTLPCCMGLADSTATRYICSWQGESSRVAAWLTEVGYTQEQADTLGTAIADLMDELRVLLDVADDGSAARLAVTLSDWDVLSTDFVVNDGELRMMSSLLPSYTLTMNMGILADADCDTDLTAALAAAAGWAGSLPVTEDTGTFTADAYSCVSRKVITVEDKDLAALAEQLLALPVFGENETTAGVLRFISGLGEANEGRIRLVLGQDSRGVTVGISLTVGTVKETLLTLSCGADSDTARLVAGMALNGCTWYLDATSAITDQGMTTDASLLRTEGSATYALARQAGEKAGTLHS